MDYSEVSNLRLLYIEDEDDTLKPMTLFLQRRFSKVITAKDGKEGFRKFNEYHPDLIITDLLLPGYGGIEMIKEIRKTGYLNPIIITSALKDASSIVKTVDLGISKYVIKPVDLDELDSTLQRLSHDILLKYRKVFDIANVEKKELEANIKRIISNILKKYTGKGPTDVKAFIRTDQIEITCLNAATLFETTLLQSGKNTALVEHCRQLLYNILRNEIEEAISAEVDFTVRIQSISINYDASIDIIHLSAD